MRESGEAGADERVETRFERLALCRIAEDLVRNPAAFGVGDELVHDVVCVDGLDAKLVQIPRHERLAARDSAGQRCPRHTVTAL